MKTLNECVSHWNAQWHDERLLFEGLLPKNEEQERLAALRSLCGKYRVARSLRLAYDEGRVAPRTPLR